MPADNSPGGETSVKNVNVNKDVIEGITCTVDNCAYNCSESNCCCAGSIDVGPHSAKAKADTICATFKKG